MKKIKYLLIIFIVLLTLINVSAKGSVTASKSNITITKGKTESFVINGVNVAGIVKISSSDTSIASVDVSEYFFDTSLNQSKVTVKVTGKKAGTTTINILLKDIGTFDGEELSGTKTIAITVKEPEVKVNNNTNSNNNSKSQEQVKQEMKIKRFEVIGYNINFNKDINEYIIDVYKNVTKLYIIVDGENFTVSNDKEINIINKDEVVVTLSNKDEKREYRIKINRVEEKKHDEISCTNVIKNSECDKKEYNIILIAMILFELLSFILIVVLIKNKINGKKHL